tara:strand:- start:193 stop:513 length:321 start_codon:yes stop_codon:yes gene_type:complete
LKNSITNKDFKKVLFSSKSLHVRDLLFYYDNQQSSSGISFIVSRKCGKAVLRNKFKRRCRSLYQKLYKNHSIKSAIIVKPLEPLDNNYSWNELSRSFELFYSKLSA